MPCILWISSRGVGGDTGVETWRHRGGWAPCVVSCMFMLVQQALRWALDWAACVRINARGVSLLLLLSE